MTRREAYFNFSKILINDNDSKESYVHKTKYKDLIIKIYDDFENESCENCNFKYVVDGMCTECRCNESPIDYLDLESYPFSCRYWEAIKELKDNGITVVKK